MLMLTSLIIFLKIKRELLGSYLIRIVKIKQERIKVAAGIITEKMYGAELTKYLLFVIPNTAKTLFS